MMQGMKKSRYQVGSTAYVMSHPGFVLNGSVYQILLGTPVKVLTVAGGHYQVALPDGSLTWLDENYLSSRVLDAVWKERESSCI